MAAPVHPKKRLQPRTEKAPRTVPAIEYCLVAAFLSVLVICAASAMGDVFQARIDVLAGAIAAPKP